MSKVWKWTAGVAAVLVVAVVALVLVLESDWAKERGIGFVLTKTGRDLSVGGIESDWGRRSRFTFRDIHFANAEWASEDEMFSAEEVSVTVDLVQLLRGRLVLPEISLIKPKVALEKNEAGEDNWTFAAKDAAKPESRHEMPLIGTLAIEDGRLSYKNPVAGFDIDGKISTAVASGGEGKSELTMEGRGTLQEEPFEVALRGGSLLSLRKTDEPYPLTIDVKAADSHAKVSGTLDDPITFDGVDLETVVEGPNLARLTRISSVPLPLSPPYEIKSRLQRDGEVWILDNLDGKLGHSDLSGRIKVDTSGERRYVEADLSSKAIDYRDIGAMIGIPDEEEKEAQKRAAEESGKQRRVLPDAPLSVRQVRGTDADVRFKAEKIAAPNLPLGKVSLMLRLNDGVIEMKPLSLDVAGGTTVVNAKIDAETDDVKTRLDLQLKDYSLKEFLSDAGLADAGSGTVNGRVVLSGLGDTLRKTLATANGDIRLVMDGGEISNLALEAAGLDIAQGLGLIAEGEKNKTVPIRCFVSDFAVQNGLLWPRLFVFDTTDTNLTLEGRADLADEALDLTIAAQPKDKSPLTVRTPVTLKGTFDKPSIGLAPGPLAAKAGAAAALGALLTPLASILAFIDPGGGKDHDCHTYLQQNQTQ